MRLSNSHNGSRREIQSGRATSKVPASSLVTDYWPNGPVHPPSLTWGAIGTWLWINPQAVTATLPEAERTNRCDVPEGVARGG